MIVVENTDGDDGDDDDDDDDDDGDIDEQVGGGDGEEGEPQSAPVRQASVEPEFRANFGRSEEKKGKYKRN